MQNWCRRLRNKTFFEQKIVKNRMFFGTLILEGFGEDFGRVWETQILDFSSFFDVISKQNLKRISDRQKIAKNVCLGGGGAGSELPTPQRAEGTGRG